MAIAGPIEQKLRARLNYGAGIPRTEVHRFGGAMARGIVERLVREGAAVLDAGFYRMAEHKPDPSVLAREAADRQARFEARKADDMRRTIAADQARRANADRIAREREQRHLWSNIGEYGSAERGLVVAERSAALRESLAILAEHAPS